MKKRTARASELHPALLFALLFTFLFVTHARLLRLPYFWDEAGYYIPAARDLLVTGSLVPETTLSNAHPPLVMGYLALWWRISGFTPAVTRTAMLLISAFALLGVYRLSKRVAPTEVAIATTLCSALYPVFFAQSTLAHLDMAAAAFTFWALDAYIADRPLQVGIFFSVATLAKETAIIAPFAILGWEWICRFRDRRRATSTCLFTMPDWKRSAALLFPILPLIAWFAYHYVRRGFVFNTEFFRYNVLATLHPVRIVISFIIRAWQTIGYMNMIFLSLAAAFAMQMPALSDGKVERPRIALPVQYVFVLLIITYAVVMSIIGGAELARYLLPVIPLFILLCVSTLRRRLRRWKLVVAIVCAGFIIGLFVDPPYGFAPEDNLAYSDYVWLHKFGDGYVDQHYAHERILTAWPASDEITRPYLGYVHQAMHVVPVDNFSLQEMLNVYPNKSKFDVALV
ncbi:MAG TPA: glycosyltransferase family 39 protein, partial [Terriglobales bacterium]|nr:glycosyltransferase family 39 protein [Terriglobales bacterium]